MHEPEKSDSAIVAIRTNAFGVRREKPTNKAEPSVAEPVQPRVETEGNADQRSTRRAQDRESVSQELERVRQAGLIEVTRASGEMFQATADVLGALVFYPDRALECVNEDYGATTELADELQRDENVPFRVGHHFASEFVTFGRANNLKPAQLPY